MFRSFGNASWCVSVRWNSWNDRHSGVRGEPSSVGSHLRRRSRPGRDHAVLPSPAPSWADRAWTRTLATPSSSLISSPPVRVESLPRGFARSRTSAELGSPRVRAEPRLGRCQTPRVSCTASKQSALIGIKRVARPRRRSLCPRQHRQPRRHAEFGQPPQAVGQLASRGPWWRRGQDERFVACQESIRCGHEWSTQRQTDQSPVLVLACGPPQATPECPYNTQQSRRTSNFDQRRSICHPVDR